MTATAWGWLAVAAVFAVGDWISRARDDKRLEYVCKPATMVTLIGLALALDPAPDQGARQALFVAALIASLAGDVFLMLPRDRFVAGLASFLVAHLCYIAGFLVHAPAGSALVIAAIAVAVAIAPLGLRIVGAVRRADRALVGPVAAYVLVIATMFTVALASGNWLAAVGAGLFVASDAMIAWTRFVGPLPGADVVIMVTYHLGQMGLVLSLAR